MNLLADFTIYALAMLFVGFIAAIICIWIQTLLKKNETFNKILGIEVCKFNHEERIEIAKKINSQVIEFMNDWSEGDSNIFTIDLFDIHLGGYDEGVVVEMEIIEEQLGIEIESWTLTDDEELALEINTHALQQVYERKMANWCRENKFESEEFWSSRGVI